MSKETSPWSEDKIKDILSKQGKTRIKIEYAFGRLERPFTVLVLVSSNEYTKFVRRKNK